MSRSYDTFKRIKGKISLNLTLLNFTSGIPALNSTSPKAYSKSWNMINTCQLHARALQRFPSGKTIGSLKQTAKFLINGESICDTKVTRRLLVPGLTTSISARASTREAHSPFTMWTMDASIANWCFSSIRQSKPKSRNLAGWNVDRPFNRKHFILAPGS